MGNMKTYAQYLLRGDADKYLAETRRSSSRNFLTSIMTSGTLSDKTSALTLAIQESPVHNVKAFEALFVIASKRSRSQAIGALGAIVDLLGPGLILPAGRRLRNFHSQPGLLGSLHAASCRTWSAGDALPGGVDEAHLISWAYEDWLKDLVFKVIQILEIWSNDEVEHSRSRALEFVFGLLREKPEQEANLLRLLVNKIGDRERRVASRASYLLLQLQNSHPGMKAVIVHALEGEVLQRPTQSLRTKYAAINTLNQTILTNQDPQTADNLLRIYFSMFVTLLRTGRLNHGVGVGELQHDLTGRKQAEVAVGSKPGKHTGDTEVVEKLVTAILTGIIRAVPFTSSDDSV
jgi:ribosome biogenesis protein MAK21